MINLDKIIGDIIFVSFKNIDRFKDIGINNYSGHYLIKGYDQLGIWLEHPKLLILNSQDSTFNANTQNIKEEILADFIVTWDNINTIMHYPERKGYDLPSEFDKKIGFNINK